MPFESYLPRPSNYSRLAAFFHTNSLLYHTLAHSSHSWPLVTRLALTAHLHEHSRTRVRLIRACVHARASSRRIINAERATHRALNGLIWRKVMIDRLYILSVESLVDASTARSLISPQSRLELSRPEISQFASPSRGFADIFNTLHALYTLYGSSRVIRDVTWVLVKIDATR